MVEVAVERLCPYCHENLTLNKKESQHNKEIQCPICKKRARVVVKGFLSKRVELVKTSFF